MHDSNIPTDEQIAVFDVAEKGAFEAAGRHPSISKSAIHKLVLSIDMKLETPVFRAYPKSMFATDDGEFYLPDARESVRYARTMTSLRGGL